MTATGTVREWRSGEGWGVIDSDATPGGCWAHFSSILAGGFRSLDPGRPVSFEFERAEQDGYAFRALAVWTGDERPASPAQCRSVAYRSTLHLEFGE
ncbi:cold-shock protein [Micromonospora mangrovi]|uniref:Cold shock domain-containing protein n=2 Tax=Micromonospora TaxID=1873 RepID=A0AAU7MIN7_9ACTN